MRIQFPHRYHKLEGFGSHATLVYVGALKIDKHTPDSLLRHDTLYFDKNGMTAFDYPRPGDYILLLFGSFNKVFTAIKPLRGSYEKKLGYYSKHIGELFEIVIKEEP